MANISSIALLIALPTSSYVFFGNVGSTATGVAHLDPILRNPNLRLQAWVKYIKAGHDHFAFTGGFTTVLHLLAAYNATNPQIRRIALASGLLGFCVIPFTVVTLFPINDELNMTAGKGLLEGKDADSKEAKRIDQLLKNWSFRHYIREGMFGVVWALGVWATLLAKPL